MSGDVKSGMRMNRVLTLPLVIAGLSLIAVSCAADDTDSGDLTPPEVIRVEGRSDGAATASEESAVADTSESALSISEHSAINDDMASDYMAPWTIVTDFVVGDLPALPTGSTGYVYRSDSTVSEDVAVRLATALGVDPTPQTRPEGYEVEWAFGPDDGTAPSLTIDAYSQHYWWYSPDWSEREAMDELYSCTETVDAEGNVTVDCPEPEPPVGVPSAEEAEAAARELISAAGFDVDGLTFEVNADEWYASVYASRQLVDGLSATGENWSFGFGAEGALQWAGGSFVAPEQVGPYPLIGIDEAVERLRENYLGSGGSVGEEVSIAVAEEVEEAAADSALAVEADDPVSGMMIDEEWEEPEEITVTLVDVAADLWWATDVDDNSWLLPAYRFIGDDGGWYTVPAVTDDYLIETPVYIQDEEPQPEPAPAPLPSVSEPDDGGVASDDLDRMMESVIVVLENQVEELDDMTIQFLEEVTDALYTEDEFADLAAAFGLTVRAVQRDGEFLMVTEDYSLTRVNVVVESGVVTAVDSIG